MRLDFTAADDAQAERLAQAWADTCAAEYQTTYRGLVRLSDGAILVDGQARTRTCSRSYCEIATHGYGTCCGGSRIMTWLCRLFGHRRWYDGKACVRCGAS